MSRLIFFSGTLILHSNNDGRPYQIDQGKTKYGKFQTLNGLLSPSDFPLARETVSPRYYSLSKASTISGSNNPGNVIVTKFGKGGPSGNQGDRRWVEAATGISPVCNYSANRSASFSL
jgi:hypothetical protein